MSSTRTRAASALVAAALGLAPLALSGVSGAAQAATRSAQTSVDTTYLADALGLPTTTVVETVTYDRFQWLLQQSGQFAFLIGNAADTDFKARAVAADAAARAAGVKKIYWFDPNLSGYAKTDTELRSLDTRNPSDINLAESSQTVFGNTWKHLLGAYLGNGIKSTAASATTVTIVADDTVVNDADSPLFDYRSGSTAATSSHDDLFFVYDKDHRDEGVADKILSWSNLSVAEDVAEVTSTVGAALTAAGGGAVIDELDQFRWWKSAANGKHVASFADAQQYGGDILTDVDAADGWRIQQVTYPELLHILDKKDDAQQNFALLFGGTWCHNTRAVLKDVNAQAQDNDVKVVYNFDLVLDGGTTNGSNGSGNPIHVRDNANSGSTTNFRPSSLYGDVVRTYLKNVVTEYDPNSGSRVSYYTKGDTTTFPDVVRKLQVPFLVNYQRGSAVTPSSTAVKRQWIQQNTDASTGLPTFKEYMSEWWFTHPSARLGLKSTYTSVSSPGFPLALAIPSTPEAAENAADSAYLTTADKALSVGDQASIVGARRALVAQALTNKAFGQEAVTKLKTFFGGLPGGVVSDQVVRAVPAKVGSVAQVNLSIANDYGRIATGQARLGIAGRTLTATVANAGASFAVSGLAAGSHPFTVSYAGDDQIVGFSKTGTLVISKASVTKVSGKVTKAPTSKKAGALTATVLTPAGLAKASGALTVTLTKGAKRAKVTAKLTTAGTAKVKLPKLAKGTWKVAVSYAGDATYLKAASTATALKIKK